jgi:hypothetical protein
MRAVVIKTGQTREKRAGLQEMGVLRCDGCAEEFVIAHQLAFAVATQQAHWLERSLRKNTSGKRKTLTGSRPFAILPFLPDVMRLFPVACRDDVADLNRYR